MAVVIAPDFETEGVDRACLRLECPPAYGNLDALIAAVAKANPNTVVVLETGAPVLTPWRSQIAALLEAWYPGAGAGPAIARVLFGDTDPGGRLPLTFPRSESQLPTAGEPSRYPGVDNEVDFGEGIFVGYRHYDEHGLEPAYPFGHGLSYTRFRFSDLRIDRTDRRGRNGVRVRIRVDNVGDRTGFAVPQLYLGLPSLEGGAPAAAGAEGLPQAAPASRRLAHGQLPARSACAQLLGRDPPPLAGRAGLLPGVRRLELAAPAAARQLRDRWALRQERGVTAARSCRRRSQDWFGGCSSKPSFRPPCGVNRARAVVSTEGLPVRSKPPASLQTSRTSSSSATPSRP